MKAIAAMSLNRVIGRAGNLPWHLPEDFRWFKQATSGGVVVMGRKTFESMGKPLPGRTNVVLTRTGEWPGIDVVRDAAEFNPTRYDGREIWIIGGAEIYRQLLPRCEELLLSVVQREVEGDTFFPAFEEHFAYVETPFKTPDFEVRRYRNLRLPTDASASIC